MNKRLLQFLSAENISQAQFADTLKVARASVSHIIAGRNKPGYDFIESMILHYPTLNIEWLITGKGRMYKGPTADVQSLPSAVPAEEDLFATQEEAAYVPATPSPALLEEPVPEAPPVRTEPKAIHHVEQAESVDNQKSIIKVTVFFSDHTFQEME